MMDTNPPLLRISGGLLIEAKVVVMDSQNQHDLPGPIASLLPWPCFLLLSPLLRPSSCSAALYVPGLAQSQDHGTGWMPFPSLRPVPLPFGLLLKSSKWGNLDLFQTKPLSTPEFPVPSLLYSHIPLSQPHYGFTYLFHSLSIHLSHAKVLNFTSSMFRAMTSTL